MFTLSEDEFLLAGQFIFGGDIANRAVQSDIIIVAHKVFDNSAGIIEGEGCLGADTFAFDGFVPTFQLAVALSRMKSLKSWAMN